MKIGILGGTFNPIHLGHIRLAEEASKALRLDKIIFIPAYLPPHKKKDKDIIPWQDRYSMIELAIEDREPFEVSDIELRRKGTSYSINTIKELKDIYSGTDQIFFITGSDSVDELKTWKDIEELKKLCTFVIATRPGYNIASLPENATIINVDTPDISSTDIRRRIRQREPFEQSVPKKVYNYIIKRKLYL